MNKTFSKLALALVVCGAAQAATIATTLTVNATAKPSADFMTFNITGTANFTGGIGNGTISASVATLTALGSDPANVPFTITLAGGGTLTGSLSVSQATLSGTASPPGGTLSVTGGTGTYSGAVGSFTLTGSVSGSALTADGITFKDFTGSGSITTGGTPPAPVPTITAVWDAASNTPGIAQGAIFIVKGTNLSASGYTPFSPPRPKISNGVKVTFTPVAGGAGTDVYLWYLYNQGGVNQIACILPSTVGVGAYNVTVTNGTVSAPVAAQVVANKIELFTQDSTGTGLASVQNYISSTVVDLNRLTTGVFNGTTISPAHPGQILIAYGTGLGGYADGDDAVRPVLDFSKTLTIQAVVGGASIPVLFAGRAGYAGEDQINFTLPANVQTGCAVPLQISVNGTLSAPTSISIAPDANSTACVIPGYTTQQLQKFDSGGTLTAGGFTITQFTETVSGTTAKVDEIGGGFVQINGFQLASAARVDPNVVQSGSCTVIQYTTSGAASGPSAGGTLTYLDAGTVSINGPSGSSLTNQALTEDASFGYSYSGIEGLGLPGQHSFTLVAGDYSLSGAGGTGVGAFNTRLTLGAPLTVTGGLPATVSRSADLVLNWTGGLASDVVSINGGSSVTTGTGTSRVTNGAEFICYTTAGKGTFTVPKSIVGQMPAAQSGYLSVASGGTPTLFTAPLKAGGSIDAGYFSSYVGVGGAPAYQ